MAQLCFMIRGKYHVKGQQMRDESIEYFCTCPLMKSNRMGGLLFNLVDDGFRQSSRNEPEMSMQKRNDQHIQ